jgi:hypothetical protein
MLLIALTFAVPWFFNITGLKQFVFSSNVRAEPEPNFLEARIEEISILVFDLLAKEQKCA